jgi:hypothetical protein
MGTSVSPCNQAARMKFADTPEKFVDSEVDLDEEAGGRGPGACTRPLLSST